VPGRAREVSSAYRALLAREGLLPWHLYSAIETDRVFAVPAQRLCEARVRATPPAASGAAGTYLYHFDFCGPLFEGELGACHTMDVPFALGTVDESFGRVFTGGGAEARALSDRMVDAWVAFARSGDPSCARLGEWPRFSAPGERVCMHLGQHCEPGPIPHHALQPLWEALI